MAEKLSKTARASLGDKGFRYEHPCPSCGTSMVATKIMKYVALRVVCSGSVPRTTIESRSDLQTGCQA